MGPQELCFSKCVHYGDASPSARDLAWKPKGADWGSSPPWGASHSSTSMESTCSVGKTSIGEAAYAHCSCIVLTSRVLRRPSRWPRCSLFACQPREKNTLYHRLACFWRSACFSSRILPCREPNASSFDGQQGLGFQALLLMHHIIYKQAARFCALEKCCA